MNSLWRFSRKYRLPLFTPPGVNGLMRGPKPQPIRIDARTASEQPQTAK
jgi:hypothetical protein